MFQSDISIEEETHMFIGTFCLALPNDLLFFSSIFLLLSYYHPSIKVKYQMWSNMNINRAPMTSAPCLGQEARSSGTKAATLRVSSGL